MPAKPSLQEISFMEMLKGKDLNAIAHKTHTATVVATSLAIRSRLRHESDITRTKNALVRQGEKIVDSDYSQFWKDLQAAGAGVIVYGRKNQPDKFKWHYSLKKVAEAMLNGSDLSSGKEEKAEVKPAALAKAMPKVIIRKGERPSLKAVEVSDRQVFIPLRPGFDLEIKVPQNVTKDEIQTIVRALSRVAQ